MCMGCTVRARCGIGTWSDIGKRRAAAAAARSTLRLGLGLRPGLSLRPGQPLRPLLPRPRLCGDPSSAAESCAVSARTCVESCARSRAPRLTSACSSTCQARRRGAAAAKGGRAWQEPAPAYSTTSTNIPRPERGRRGHRATRSGHLLRQKMLNQLAQALHLAGQRGGRLDRRLHGCGQLEQFPPRARVGPASERGRGSVEVRS